MCIARVKSESAAAQNMVYSAGCQSIIGLQLMITLFMNEPVIYSVKCRTYWRLSRRQRKTI